MTTAEWLVKLFYFKRALGGP